MLQTEDFYPRNWESVTWQIVSGTYVRGHILSACMPPPSYIEWVMESMNLMYPGAVQIENTVGEDGTLLWKLTIRQADGHWAGTNATDPFPGKN
jgi:hypothetical protein